MALNCIYIVKYISWSQSRSLTSLETKYTIYSSLSRSKLHLIQSIESNRLQILESQTIPNWNVFTLFLTSFQVMISSLKAFSEYLTTLNHRQLKCLQHLYRRTKIYTSITNPSPPPPTKKNPQPISPSQTDRPNPWGSQEQVQIRRERERDERDGDTRFESDGTFERYILSTFMNMRFNHHTYNRSISSSKLFTDILHYLFLVSMIFLGCFFFPPMRLSVDWTKRERRGKKSEGLDSLKISFVSQRLGSWLFKPPSKTHTDPHDEREPDIQFPWEQSIMIAGKKSGRALTIASRACWTNRAW